MVMDYTCGLWVTSPDVLRLGYIILTALKKSYVIIQILVYSSALLTPLQRARLVVWCFKIWTCDQKLVGLNPI